MATKMSNNKREFLAKMVCREEDYRRNPEKSIEIWNRLPNEAKRKRFYLKPQHFFEAAWMLRDYLNIDHRFSKILNEPSVVYLDGEEKRHIDATYDIYKDGRLVGVLYLSNIANIHLCVDRTYYFGPDKHLTVKEFYRAVREARDFIKAF